MEVYALIGPSGSGKSTLASTLADRQHISTMIDDGLLIHEGRKVAGFSSKYEQTTVAAVKRAIFHDPGHRREVADCIRKLDPDKLLILGTSRKMADRIAEALELPPISRYIDIEEVSTPHDIRMARFIRQTKGKHTIPIPQIQVEKDRWEKLKARVEQIFSSKKELIGERTIVRPAFQIGEITIGESTLKKIVALSVREVAPALQAHKIEVSLEPDATVSLALSVPLVWGEPIPELARRVQRQVHASFRHHLDIELQSVDVYVQRLTGFDGPPR